MGYTVDSGTQRTIVWNDNPYGSETRAVIDADNNVTELVIQNERGINVVYTLDQTLLSHIQTVISELLAEVAVP